MRRIAAERAGSGTFCWDNVGEWSPVMIFGLAVTLGTMMLGGIILFALVLFQVLAGLRIIKLGRKNREVHKWVGIAILGVAAVHGLLGVALGLGLRIG
jgi:hypothetical protein